MTDIPLHPFRPGERYENRKGLFEVISIEGDAMRIRWDTGEEVSTSVAFQAKILDNMEREITEAGSRKAGKTPRSFGEFFRGLKAEDFAEDVTGTHWRSREQLGGAVTKLLDVREPFNSWSIYGRPEVHWASISRYRLHHPTLQTKFFARVTGENICFGVYTERSHKTGDNQDDWLKFAQWIEQAKNATWLHDTLRRIGGVITNPYSGWPGESFHGTITPTDAGYSWARPGESKLDFSAGELGVVLGGISPNEWLDLFIGRTLPSDAAIAEGERIAAVIAEQFNTLMPIYQNAVPAR